MLGVTSCLAYLYSKVFSQNTKNVEIWDLNGHESIEYGLVGFDAV